LQNGLDWGANHSLAAQPGKVSDRQTFRNEGKFEPHFKGQFLKRICELESSHPSHTVRSLLCDFWPFSNSGRGAVAQQVQKVEGNTLQVKYKDGEKTIVVPSDAEVVNLVAGGKARLKTGAHVFIPRWEKQGDGTWQATVVVVGRDGITPPM
jgi:hypothetical protein